MKEVDLLVIGGGTGGLRAGIAASRAGLETIIFEPGALGGTCLNVGCIPTKAMLYASHLYAQETEEFGISTTKKLNFPKLMKRVQSIITEGQDHIAGGLERNKKLTVIKQRATFVDNKTVKAGKTTYKGKKVLIATGASNFIPPIPDLKKAEFLTNDELVNLKRLPTSVIMIGGGYISMEFATFFAQLGTKVTVLEAMPHILGMLDEDVREVLVRKYRDMGVKIVTGAKITGIKQTKTYTQVTYETDKQKTIKASKLCVATGRKPNTQNLGLENTKIKVGKRGNVYTNSALETTVKDVYALGDVSGKPMFAHAAKRETQLVLYNMMHKSTYRMNFDLMPWAVFTSPPVAGIGISEKQAKAKVDIYKSPFTKAGRARIIGDQEGFVKIICQRKKILGAVIVGPNADDLIHEIAVVMFSDDPTIDAIKRTIHVHPTLSEVMEGLRKV